jgi:uncharacterized protein YbjT (DUF2867 family)
MPLLVVGADHPIGEAIVRRTVAPDREVRAFVSDPEVGGRLKKLGVKVAAGDLSDEGHIAAAATRCFAIAFVLDAIFDGRDLAFAPAGSVPSLWARAAEAANVQRVIWIGDDAPQVSVSEVATVVTAGRTSQEVAEEVAAIDDRASL